MENKIQPAFPLKKFLPLLISSTTKISLGKSVDLEKTIFNPETKRISELRKIASNKEIDSLLSVIFSELSFLCSANWSAEQIVLVANNIGQTFSDLRFEELVYILNKGVNGDYGKIYGALNYIQVAEWFQNYYAGEFEDVCLKHNQRIQGERKQEMKDWKTDFTPLIEKFTAKELEAKGTISKPRTLEQIDSEQHDFILAYKDQMSEEEISLFKQACEKNGYKKTLALLEKITTTKTEDK